VRALTLTAKAICMQCPVSTQCLQYALDLDIAHGIWGGADETERMRLRRRR
jgi:WhiB family redox-sensing transcriptional regulator